MADAEDDMIATLEEYKVQLKQVEDAMVNDQDNEELLRLKADLEEVIGLTEALVKQDNQEEQPQEEVKVDETAEATTSYSYDPIAPVKQWKEGDRCSAVWSGNGRYHNAVIEHITGANAVVKFDGYTTAEVNSLLQLRLPTEKPETNKKRNQRNQEDREKRKAKSQKYMQKVKEIDAVKETEKKSWQLFNKKGNAKALKGVKRSSVMSTHTTDVKRIAAGGSAEESAADTGPTRPTYIRGAAGYV